MAEDLLQDSQYIFIVRFEAYSEEFDEGLRQVQCTYIFLLSGSNIFERER